MSVPLVRNFGGAVWATESEQNKHPTFVVVPCYPEIILDDHDTYTMTDYVELTARMIWQRECLPRVINRISSYGKPAPYDFPSVAMNTWHLSALDTR